MGKIKKEKKDKEYDSFVTGDESMVQENGDQELSYDQKLNFVNVISKPMASKKLAKKLYKLIRKASKHKNFFYNGLKNVQTKIRKGERGLVILAGDISPLEMMCHMPAVCEEKQIPYCYTPLRQDLGTAMGVKRGTMMVLIKKHEDYDDLYNTCTEELKNLPQII